LDGFLTALAAGPDGLARDTWLAALLGPAAGDAAAAAPLTVRRNEIAAGLRQNPPACAPRLEDGGAAAWCAGFVAAVRLAPEAWQAMLADREAAALLLPMLLAAGDAADAAAAGLDAAAWARLQEETPEH